MAERKAAVRPRSPKKSAKTPLLSDGPFVTTSGRVQLPPEALADLEAGLAAFNRRRVKSPAPLCCARVEGRYAFVSRNMGPRHADKLFRLEWRGAVDTWSFAIYRYSRDDFDPHADFPGEELLDGTISGALKAANKAYPPDWSPDPEDTGSLLSALLALASSPPRRTRRSRT